MYDESRFKFKRIEKNISLKYKLNVFYFYYEQDIYVAISIVSRLYELYRHERRYVGLLQGPTGHGPRKVLPDDRIMAEHGMRLTRGKQTLSNPGRRGSW